MPSAAIWETYGTHATNAHANYRPSRSNPGTLSITIDTRIEAYIMATGTFNGTPHKSHVSSRDYSNAKAHNRRPRQLKSSLTNQVPRNRTRRAGTHLPCKPSCRNTPGDGVPRLGNNDVHNFANSNSTSHQHVHWGENSPSPGRLRTPGHSLRGSKRRIRGSAQQCIRMPP